MRRAVLCAALAAASLPLGAGAQTLTLTESEALARLSSTNPRVQAIRAVVDIARVDVLAASRWPNPQPSLTRESVAGVTEYLTTVSQVLPITGRRGLGRAGGDGSRVRQREPCGRRSPAPARRPQAHLRRLARGSGP